MKVSVSLLNLLGMLFCAFIVTAACSSEPEVRKRKEIKKDIKTAEKKVTEASKSGAVTAEFKESTDELMTALLEYYHAYPKDKYSAECVTKVHMLHSALGNVEKAVAYGDTLLDQFPKYDNRAQVIESLIQAYEMDIKPRNVEKIRGYLELWLAENKKAPKEKIEDMEYHLKFVSMSLEERMRMNMEALD
ncbi:MAG: hypothetical protein NXI10_11770 [bacterium]|nr:hypothetical protein [bacterium]